MRKFPVGDPVRGGDGDAFARARVATLTRGSRSRREGFETGNRGGVAAGNSVGGGGEHGVHGGVDGRPGHGRLGSYSGGELGFGHGGSAPEAGRGKRITRPIAADHGISGGSAFTAQGAESGLDGAGAVIAYRVAMVRFGNGCDRKQVGNRAGIRCAHRSVALSTDAIRVGPYEESPRGRHPTCARDCACLRACAESKNADMNCIGRKRHLAVINC